MNLTFLPPVEATYHVVTDSRYQTPTRRGYSVRRRDGANPNDYATVYAERARTSAPWHWSCFRCGGRLTAEIAIQIAQDYQETTGTL